MQYNTLPAYLIDVAWAVFILVWLVTMFTAKRSAAGTRGRGFIYRIGIAVVIYIFLRYNGGFGSALTSYIHVPLVRWIGVVLVYFGVAIAVWARFHLGRNWGMPMSEKEGAELVTTGPYAYVRNPIYTGIFFATIGSALTAGLLWAIIFVIYVIYLFPSIFVEERVMARLFPDQYPEYKKRTKRLIPWVW